MGSGTFLTTQDIVTTALLILYLIEVALGFSKKIKANNTWQLARDLAAGAIDNSVVRELPAPPPKPGGAALKTE
jgi:hypothetical protein